jgi:nucleoside diphosphate kinase
MTHASSYVLITPSSLQRERTGGILSRLLSRTDLELTAVQLIAFDAADAAVYAARLEQDGTPMSGRLADYVKTHFTAENRALLLLFHGEYACGKLNAVVGSFAERAAGDAPSIRDTFAEYGDGAGRFEPAVLTPIDDEAAAAELKILSAVAARSPNVAPATGIERTLVMLKPENLRAPSTRVGGIIDLLSGTGLRIVGGKLLHMSVNDALTFYAPVMEVLTNKFVRKIAEKSKLLLENELQLKLPEAALQHLETAAGRPFAEENFAQIIEFMSGRRPENCPETERRTPNEVKCLILIYEGVDAIAKIRRAIGATDPAKAAGGTVRYDFGTDITVNAVHASDSPENVRREMKIVRIAENELAELAAAPWNN